MPPINITGNTNHLYKNYIHIQPLQPSSAIFLNFEGKTPQNILKSKFQLLKMIKY